MREKRFLTPFSSPDTFFKPAKTNVLNGDLSETSCPFRELQWAGTFGSGVR